MARSRKPLASPSNRWTTPCSGFAAKWRGSFHPAISATAERNIFHLKERVKSCTKTRLWFARSAVRSSCSPPVSRSSMLSAASRTSPSAARPRRSQERRPRPPGVLHRHLRCLRRRGPRALRAQERPSCLLQRLLRQDARERLIADSVNCKIGCPPRWTADFYFKSGISPPAHSHRPCAGCRWRRRYSRISGSRSPQWRPAWRGYPRGCLPAHSRKGRCRS